MVLNLVWIGFILIGFVVALIRLAQGDVAIFTKVLTALFDTAKIPAGGSIVMNFSANMLGLDNAATPMGLKAMRELQDINPDKAVASNPMIMFLVLNTAGITLIPTSVIAMRQSIAVEQGLQGFNAADIFLPTLIGTFISFTSWRTVGSGSTSSPWGGTWRFRRAARSCSKGRP